LIVVVLPLWPMLALPATTTPPFGAASAGAARAAMIAATSGLIVQAIALPPAGRSPRPGIGGAVWRRADCASPVTSAAQVRAAQGCG